MHRRRRWWLGSLALLTACGVPDDRAEETGVAPSPLDDAMASLPLGAHAPPFRDGARPSLDRVTIAGPPVWIEEQLLVPGDMPPGAEVGYSADLDGDTVVLGAYGDDALASNSGSAYIFRRTAQGWQEEAKLVPGDAEVGDDFGYAVAVDGDTVVVGAYQDDDNGPNSGSAYVFVRDGMGTWSQQAKLLPTDGAPYANFGIEAVVDGDRIAVGAHQDDDNGGASGSVYLFTRSGAVFTQTQKLVASDGALLDLFGRALALEGDTLVVGAQRDDDMGDDSGSVYVFTAAGGTFTQHQKLTAFDGAPADNFGFSVDLSGDTLAVGSHQCDIAAADAGAVYVFRRDALGDWSLEQQIVASDGAAGDHFGRELSLWGHRLVVGAWEDDDLGAESGSAYVFGRVQGNQWVEEQKLTASDGIAGDFFGRAVAFDGASLVIGAHGKSGQMGAGYAFSTLLPNGDPCATSAQCADNLVTERTIDTHVRRIRAKFRRHECDPIATVYGVGYKAADP